ncbi:MAG: hypothetical protein HUU20_15915 [Pirellulales bacterium]|nr:hypothetical protein [Pirellulales bacterium]
MTLLDRLERRFGRWAVPNVTIGLILGQVFVYVMEMIEPGRVPNLALVPKLVLEGEVWRVFSFVFEPPLSSPIWAFFFWYVFYLLGTALEQTWGSFRYNVYILIGWAATVAASFLVPEAPTSVGFLQGSIFLAFAWLYPDFVFYIFFVLPVKVKWLALLAWIGYFMQLAFGDTVERVLVLASIANFLVFFGKGIFLRMRIGRRRMVEQADRIRSKQQSRHQCSICGITERTHPDEDFRYCSKCEGTHCYCSAHLRNHEHISSDAETAKR